MPINQAGIDRLLSWDGIGRAFIRRIETFEDVVRANAPYRADSARGHLVDTIGHVLGEEGTALTARVGANPAGQLRGYALIVHNGSKAHPILPRPPRQSLKFKTGGRIVYAHRVNHPGTTPDPFLTRWMKEITG